MKKLRALAFLALALISVPVFLGALAQFIADSRAPATYATFAGGDEIFVVRAAERVYRDGYFGLRCREGHTGSCYGGTQILLDGLTLKTLPSSWLLGEEIARAPDTVQWPYLQTFPRMLQALRWSRVGYAVALVLVIGAVGFFFTRDWLAGAALALALGSSPLFANAWQGAKNDFCSALWEIFFLLAVARAFRSLARREFFLALAVGTLAVFVRPVLLPMLALFPVAYALQAAVQARRGLFWDLVGGGVLVGSLFLFLHPNLFVSSLEANWIVAVLHMGTRVATPEGRLAEFQIALYVGWIWFFALAAIFLSRRELRLVPVLYFLANGALLFYLNLKTAYLRPYYYLPAFTLGLALLALYWPRGKNWFPFALTAALLTVNFHDYGFAIWNRQLRAAVATPLETLLQQPANSWLLDLAVQPPLRRREGEKIFFFDSLSESPAEVKQRLGFVPEKILVACWGEVKLGDFDFPAARAWNKLTGTHCPLRADLTPELVSPFVSNRAAPEFALLSGTTLETSLPEKYFGTKIHPRALAGFWQGQDTFGAPLILKRSASLRLSAIFPRGISRLRGTVASSCKGAASLEVRVNGEAQTFALDQAKAFCGDYPRLCGYPWFRKWSDRRYPIVVDLPARVKPGSFATLELKASLPECSLELREFILLPAAN